MVADYERMMTRSQTQIRKKNPVKCMKILFAEKNGLVMQNYELGINSDKFWADSTPKNTLN